MARAEVGGALHTAASSQAALDAYGQITWEGHGNRYHGTFVVIYLKQDIDFAVGNYLLTCSHVIPNKAAARKAVARLVFNGKLSETLTLVPDQAIFSVEPDAPHGSRPGDTGPVDREKLDFALIPVELPDSSQRQGGVFGVRITVGSAALLVHRLPSGRVHIVMPSQDDRNLPLVSKGDKLFVCQFPKGALGRTGDCSSRLTWVTACADHGTTPMQSSTKEITTVGR
jgi:hypothetical protein